MQRDFNSLHLSHHIGWKVFRRGFKVAGCRIQIALKGQKYYQVVLWTHTFQFTTGRMSHNQWIASSCKLTYSSSIAFFLTFQQLSSKNGVFPRNSNAQWIASVWRGGGVSKRPFYAQGNASFEALNISVSKLPVTYSSIAILIRRGTSGSKLGKST